MTCKEKFENNFPGFDCMNFCPCESKIADIPEYCTEGSDNDICERCWNREIPETPTEEKTVNEQRAEVGLEPIRDIPYIKDSGNRREFSSGAVRDMQEGKGRCDLMPLEVVAEYLTCSLGLNKKAIAEIANFKRTNCTLHLYNAIGHFVEIAYGNSDITMLLEVAKHFEEGAKKYGENNWQKGIPPKCYIDSAVRHYLKWLRGDKDEPHDRAFVWNLMCCIWEVDYGETWRKDQEGTVN